MIPVSSFARRAIAPGRVLFWTRLVLATLCAVVAAPTLRGVAAEVEPAVEVESASGVEPAVEVESASGVEPAPVSISGEWYVLVHFTDRSDPEPTRVQWLDAVWRFEDEGTRLRWTEFTIVAFRDDSGRHEQIAGVSARLRTDWRPSQRQMDEIRSGLKLGTRNVRSKTLRADGRSGWITREAIRAGSASSVGYSEQWRIGSRPSGPLFERTDTLASGRSDTLEGATRFEVDSTDAPGGFMRGRYSRDGLAEGEFWMWRKGASREADAEFVKSVCEQCLLGPGGPAQSSVRALEERIATGGEGTANRQAIRDALQALVEESYTRRGASTHRYREEIDLLTLEIERLVVVEGVPLEEVDRRFASGELLP